MSETLSDLALGALRELSLVFTRMSDDCADELIDAIITARKIVLFSCGREGLQMRGLAMRLFHLGRDATVWGDMSMPAGGAQRPTYRVGRARGLGDSARPGLQGPRSRSAHSSDHSSARGSVGSACRRGDGHSGSDHRG